MLCVRMIVFFCMSFNPDVVWEYSMETIPTGWYSEGDWTCSTNGTYLYNYSSGGGSVAVGILHSGSDSILVPSNCDSIILSIDDHFLIYEYGTSAGGYALIRNKYSSTNWLDVWEHSYMGGSGSGSGPDSLHISIPVVAEEYLSIKFYGYVFAFPAWSYSQMIWGLKDISLTFWCDGSSITYRTWGDLKSSYQ